jgi:hypothetical protein
MGPIDVLISNASCGLESTVKESGMNDLHRQLDVNFVGSDAITKAVQPYMGRRRRCRISTLDADNSPVHLMPGTDALRLMETREEAAERRRRHRSRRPAGLHRLSRRTLTHVRLA